MIRQSNALLSADPDDASAQIDLLGVPWLMISEEPSAAPNTSFRIGSSEGSSRGYAQGCPLVIHSDPRAGWSCPAAGPGLGPAPN
jgi:hypothetical protein